jgi:hypothetical protein
VSIEVKTFPCPPTRSQLNKGRNPDPRKVHDYDGTGLEVRNESMQEEQTGKKDQTC